MGAPEILIALFLLGVPALCAWGFYAAARHRARRNSRHYVRALGNVADRADPAHDEFWRRR